jgi:dipeptidyl aminopeptidase/acylaminoacyl peptidase
VVVITKEFQMKQLFLLTLLFIITSCTHAQNTRIISQKKVDWKNFPKLYLDIEKEHFIKPFSALSEVDVEEITYWSDSLKIEAFAAIPKKEGKYPVIIYNRGGNRDFGALQLFKGKGKYPVAYFFTQLAKEGYIVIGCNYRGCGKSEGKDEFGGSDVNDILNLIEVLKEIPQADVSHIGMYGWSRGGMMTYLALTKTNQIKAAVVGGAPTDQTIVDRSGMETDVYAELIPNYWKNKDTELKKRSACFFADQFSKEVPILILHGNADWRVKSTQSLKLALEFEEHRVPYRLKIFEGGDHGLRAFRAEVDKEVLSWFDRFLKENEPVPNMALENGE